MNKNANLTIPQRTMSCIVSSEFFLAHLPVLKNPIVLLKWMKMVGPPRYHTVPLFFLGVEVFAVV